MEVDQVAPSAGPSTPPMKVATVLETVQSLLVAQQNLAPAYLHPYAPTPWKGKSKATQLSLPEQLSRVQGLRDALEAAKGVLGRKDGGDWGRLGRALREVTTHQMALFPSTSSLRPPELPPVDLPSTVAMLSPIDMLKSLAAELDIQTYLEDSQFGLLKTSLTLAGNRFVVDIDLETDSAEEGEGENEDDEAMPLSSAKPVERGKVRLAKLAANHVTKEGGTGKSDWIGTVLREVVEQYLAVWNVAVEGVVEGAKRAMKLEKAVRSIREVLDPLKWLDDLAVHDEGRGVYSELEEVAKRLQDLTADENVLPTSPSSLLPAFHLLPGIEPGYNPIFCLRPARPDESVPALSISKGDAALPQRWIIQFVSQPGKPDGLPVRPNWLSIASSEEPLESSWNGAIKVENMLYAEGLPSSIPQTFPYTSEFVHVPAGHKKSGLKQHWTMSQPGPDVFMVGRLGLPVTAEAFGETTNLLRNQAILNRLWVEIFIQSKAVDSSQVMENDEDVNIDDILSSAPSDIPVSVKYRSSALELSLPWAHEAGASLITLRATPTMSSRHYEVTFEVKGSDLSETQKDATRSAVQSPHDGLVDLVASVVQALE